MKYQLFSRLTCSTSCKYVDIPGVSTILRHHVNVPHSMSKTYEGKLVAKYSSQSGPSSFSIQQSLDSQLHLGHHPSEWDPNMAPFLKGHRKGHHIFEASTTCLYLRRALQVLYYTASQGGQVLFMGKSPKVSGITKGQSKRHNPYVRILETAAIACSQPYFNGDSQSWISGTFTNWNEYLQQRRNNEVSSNDYGPGYNETTKYSSDMDEIITSTSSGPSKYDGHEMSDLLMGRKWCPPSIIFVIGMSELEQPLREAHKIGIPIIAVVDSNNSPKINDKYIDYIIPANDDSIRSYAFLCSLVSKSIINGHIDNGHGL